MQWLWHKNSLKKASTDTTFQKRQKNWIRKKLSDVKYDFGHSLKYLGYQVDQLENELFLDKKSDKSKYAQNSLCDGKISWSLR